MFYRMMHDVHTYIVTENNTRMNIIHHSIEHTAFSAEYTLSTTSVILI